MPPQGEAGGRGRGEHLRLYLQKYPGVDLPFLKRWGQNLFFSFQAYHFTRFQPRGSKIFSIRNAFKVLVTFSSMPRPQEIFKSCLQQLCANKWKGVVYMTGSHCHCVSNLNTSSDPVNIPRVIYPSTQFENLSISPLSVSTIHGSVS